MNKWIDDVYEPFHILFPEKKILLLDNFKVHINEQIVDRFESDYNTSLMIIPSGCTKVFQPLDLLVIRKFKDNIRKNIYDNDYMSKVIPRKYILDMVKNLAFDTPRRLIRKSFDPYG